MRDTLVKLLEIDRWACLSPCLGKLMHILRNILDRSPGWTKAFQICHLQDQAVMAVLVQTKGFLSNLCCLHPVRLLQRKFSCGEAYRCAISSMLGRLPYLSYKIMACGPVLWYSLYESLYFYFIFSSHFRVIRYWHNVVTTYCLVIYIPCNMLKEVLQIFFFGIKRKLKVLLCILLVFDMKTNEL